MEKLFKNTGIKEKVINEIQDIAKNQEVKKVILFGSRARGDFQRASDIDLAVEGGNIDMFRLDVDEYTSTLLMFDVVKLKESLDSDLLNEIKRDGILIYEEV